jgi:hypothetical protein
LLAGQVGTEEVRQALDFYCTLNGHQHAPGAQSLSRGSEACFTLNEHLACVDRRLDRLASIEGTTPAQIEAAAFVHDRLMPVWRRMRSNALSQAAARNLALDEAVSDRDRCISPSDFGFHNAICAADGRLWFIDFEYAGWDDPARMVCDFFSQPAVPVPADFFASFVDRVAASLSDPERHALRIRLLLPIYRMKWCCIMLNEFLPTGRDRRSFAADPQNEEERECTQLQKARRALDEIETCGVA